MSCPLKDTLIMSNPCWTGNHSSTGGAGKLPLWKNRKARTREKPGGRTVHPHNLGRIFLCAVGEAPILDRLLFMTIDSNYRWSNQVTFISRYILNTIFKNNHYIIYNI
jgi:hypothetical protein